MISALFPKIYHWQHLNYASSFALVISLNLLVAASIIFGLFVLCRIINCICLRISSRKEHLKVKIIQAHVPTQDEVQQEVRPSRPRSRGTCFTTILNILSTIFVLIATFIVSFIPSIFYGLHMIPLAASISSLLAFYFVCLILLILHLGRETDERTIDIEERPIRQNRGSRLKLAFRRYKVIIVLLFLVSVGFGVVIPLFMQDTCLCSDANSSTGIPIQNNLVFSTRMMRNIMMKKNVCPAGAPCHVYATLPADTSSAVFINAHTDYDVDGVTVSYDTLNFYNTNASSKILSLFS